MLISSRLCRLCSMYERQLITVEEFSESLLVAVAGRDGSLAELTSHRTDLPGEVIRRLDVRLQQVERAGHRWRPFLIGPGGGDLEFDPAVVAGLRQFCATAGSPGPPENQVDP